MGHSPQGGSHIPVLKPVGLFHSWKLSRITKPLFAGHDDRVFVYHARDNAQPTYFIHGPLCADEQLNFQGNVVILGNQDNNAKICATGDVTVIDSVWKDLSLRELGKLRSGFEVHAGGNLMLDYASYTTKLFVGGDIRAGTFADQGSKIEIPAFPGIQAFVTDAPKRPRDRYQGGGLTGAHAVVGGNIDVYAIGNCELRAAGYIRADYVNGANLLRWGKEHTYG